MFSGEGNVILLNYTVNYMMQARDQSAANIYLCDDPSVSFACRMYSIFALFILGNSCVFNMLRDGLPVLVKNNTILILISKSCINCYTRYIKINYSCYVYHHK